MKWMRDASFVSVPAISGTEKALVTNTTLCGPTLLLEINGEHFETQTETATPLIFLLRNTLGLTGTKLGCGLEQCRACVVLADGESTPSCTRPAEDFAGKWIVTIEGLPRLHHEVTSRVMSAFIAEGAAQCGYCTPGMVIALAGALLRNPDSYAADLCSALKGHLCRCGSYAAIRRAIDRISGETAHGRKD